MTTPLARLNSRPSAWLYLGGGKRPRVRSADATGARPSACACVQVCGSLLSCSVRTLPSTHASRMRVHVLCGTRTCPWSDLQATSVPDQPRVYGLWVRVSIVGTSFPIRLVVSARMKLRLGHDSSSNTCYATRTCLTNRLHVITHCAHACVSLRYATRSPR